MMKARDLISHERQRQIERNAFAVEKDEPQGVDILAMAAMCYRAAVDGDSEVPALWPMERDEWQPTSRKVNLARAGALYMAASSVAELQHKHQRKDELLEEKENCVNLLAGEMALNST